MNENDPLLKPFLRKFAENAKKQVLLYILEILMKINGFKKNCDFSLNELTSNLSIQSVHSFAFFSNSAYSMYSASRCKRLSGSLKTTGIEIRVRS